LRHFWAVSSGGKHIARNVVVELAEKHGPRGLGEAAPSVRYGESAASVLEFLHRVDGGQLSFSAIPESMAYLERVDSGHQAAKAALNMALWDGAARAARQSVHAFLGLGFPARPPLTSYSIGIDCPETIQEKTEAAAAYPILKLKVGSNHDPENLAALRQAAPTKTVRVDANEAWTSKEQALAKIQWLALDPGIELIEQPMPASTPARDLAWLKERSPLPLFADESYRSAADLASCRDVFHGVNVKLTKTAGLSGAHDALVAARQAGLKTMIGCMIESSLGISAGAQLAALADYLDLDGNLLIENDPFEGVQIHAGQLAFEAAAEPWGLGVRTRRGASASPPA
jgi:L-alanine-DL-glutamate epimerase-like enolase superfamily enzyme